LADRDLSRESRVKPVLPVDVADQFDGFPGVSLAIRTIRS